MKHAERYCPFCKSSDFTLFDQVHGETFCEKCGFIFTETNRNITVEQEEKTGKKTLFSGELLKNHMNYSSTFNLF